MNNQIYDGGPVCPIPHSTLEHEGQTLYLAGWDGMTLRDYFAAKALQGALASDAFRFIGPQEKAETAYQMADAMLAARGV